VRLASERRFEAIDRRFEAVDRRFEELRADMNTGFGAASSGNSGRL